MSRKPDRITVSAPPARLLSAGLSLALHAAALGAVLHWMPSGFQCGTAGDSQVFTLNIGLQDLAAAAGPAISEDQLELPAPAPPEPPAEAPVPFLAATAENAPPSAAASPKKAAVPRKNPGPGPGGTRSGQVTPPSYLHAPPPLYPEALRRSKMKGLVLLEVRVSEKGVPTEVRLKRSSGQAAFDRAALEGVSRWSFNPARCAGVSVDCWVEVPVRFEMR